MGFGDEIMASGNAYYLHRESGQRVAILDKNGDRRWHPLWEGNKFLIKPKEQVEEDYIEYTHGSSCRPYVDYGKTTKERWAYTNA